MGKGLKIGFDAKRAYNNMTGLGNYSRFVIGNMLHQFMQHQYSLYTPFVDERFKDIVPLNNHTRVVMPQTFLGKVAPAMWRSFSLADQLIKDGLNVFHGLSNELPVGIEKFAGKKVVTIHDLIFLRYTSYYNNIDRYIYKKKFAYACEQADVIVATSEQTKQDIVRFFNTSERKIHVVYQDCDKQFSVKVDDAGKQQVKQLYNLPDRYVLSVGTLEQRKNQLTILKALQQLKDREIKLVLVGKPTAYANELRTYMASNKLTDRVQFVNNVAFEHLPAIYQMAKVFVYASEFEGFGIPVLEGLRSSIPVVAADSSSLPEVGGKAARYFPFDQEDQLTEILDAVLSSAELSREMVEAGLVQAAKFDSSFLMDQLNQLYQ